MCSKEVNHLKSTGKVFPGKGNSKGRDSEAGRNKLAVFREHKEGKPRRGEEHREQEKTALLKQAGVRRCQAQKVMGKTLDHILNVRGSMGWGGDDLVYLL